MTSRRSSRERLSDMDSAITKIETFLSGKSEMDFSQDAMLHDAVVRNLEVLSEASRHVDEPLKAHAPEVPWRNVADIGNWLRHGLRCCEGSYSLGHGSTRPRDPARCGAPVDRLIR